MKKHITLLLLSVLFILKGQAQNTITPDAFIANNLCAGSTIEVPYNISGTFNPGNIFTAQLSDEFGTFSSFSNIGSVVLTTAGTINCTIPTNINTSANYLIRIVSTDPPVFSPDNLIALTYFARPIADFDFNVPHKRFLQGSFIGVQNRSVNQFLCNWDFGQGAIPGTDNSCAPGPFVYGSTGAKSVKLVITSPFGCLDSFIDPSIEVYDCNPAIGPNTIVVTGTVNWVPSGSSVWVCAGGVYNSNNHSNQTIFVETGGTINLVGGGNNLVYVKAGGTVIASVLGYTNTYIFETGASLSNLPESNHAFYNCPGLTYNYCSAPLNGCFVTAPQATITPGGPTTFCIGDSVLLTASLGDSYLWSNGDITQTTMVHSAGSYTVSVSYLNGCTRVSDPVSIVTRSQPVAVLSAMTPTSICTGDSVILSATEGMSSYLWSNGLTTRTIAVYTSNTYDVEITNQFGCKDTSSAVTITANPIPVIYPSGPTSFCSGDSVELSTDFGTTYLWSNGQTDQSIRVHNTSTMTVQVTGSSTCALPSLPEIITEWSLPNTSVLASGPIVFCTGGTVTLTASPATSYLWSDGSTDQTIQISSSGTYKVIVENFNQCIDSSNVVTITVNPLPDATITANGPLTYCSGVNRMLSAPAGMIQYEWSLGYIDRGDLQSCLVNSSGTYGVTVTDVNNCINSSVVSVTVLQSPNPSLIATRPPLFCDGDSTILIASGGSSYLWSTGATSSSIKVDTSGIYTVQAFTHGVCTAPPLSITATSIPMPMPVITSSGLDSICTGESVTLYGNGASKYFWSFGVTGDSVIVNNSKLNFTLTGYNGPNNMCAVTTAPYSVFVAPLPSTYYTGIKMVKCPSDTAVFSATSGSNLSYQWHVNGNPITGNTSRIFETTLDGQVYFVVTNEFGCFDTSDTKTVINDVPAKPVLSYNSSGYYLYTTDPSYQNSYLWSRNDTIINGEVKSNHWVSVNGNYKVWVRSKSLCYTASDPFSYTWVSTEDIVTVSNWKAYPNPASDFIRVTTEGEEAEFVLTDMQGRALRNGWINGTGEVMVQDLPAGVYHLKVTSGNRQAQFKVQVMH
jgi:hypothetical protein